MATKAATLATVTPNPAADLFPGSGAVAGVAEGGQQHQHDDHDQVLDDEPSDREAPAVGRQQPMLLQGFGEHDGAAAGEGEAEQQTGIGRPPETEGQRHAKQCGDGQLPDGAWQGSRPDGHQIGEREMQADGEEQQDDANLGELVRQRLIGHEARREGADHDAGEQIADQRRDAQPVRRETEPERQDEACGDRRDEWCFVFRHRALHLVPGDGPDQPARLTDEATSPRPAMQTAGAVGCAAVSGNLYSLTSGW